MSQSAYEKGLIRHDRGQYIDKGNYAYDPRHPDFGGGGADPDGIRDSRRAFADCDTEALAFGAGCTVGPGTYLINSDLTLSAAWSFPDGAILKPADDVVVTFSAAVNVGLTQFVDTSLGGSVAFTSGPTEVRPEWFGAVDAGTIQAAINAASAPSGGVVYLQPGSFALGASLLIEGSCTLRGEGTRLLFASGADSRFILIREAEKVELHGIRIVQDFDDGSANDGVAIQNSSDVILDDVWLEDVSNYGVVISQNTTTDLSEACNDIVVRRCYFDSCGTAAINGFPKTLSENLTVEGNDFVNCGLTPLGVGVSGTTIKVGQATKNTIVRGNRIVGGATPIAIANWETMLVENNVIVDTDSHGASIAASVHSLYTASFERLVVKNNTLMWHDGYTPVSTTRSAFNIEGVGDGLGNPVNGIIDITDNTVIRWARPLALQPAVAIPNVRFARNRFIACEAVAISDNTNGAYAAAPVWEDNLFLNTDPARAIDARLYGTGAVIKGNTFDGYGERPLRALGDTLVQGNLFRNCNPSGAGVSRGAIYIAGAGTYKIRDNTVLDPNSRISYVIEDGGSTSIVESGNRTDRLLQIANIMTNVAAPTPTSGWVSIGGRRHFRGSSMPVSGTYYAGDFVENIGPAVLGTAGSRYIIRGWRRLTSGTANVANTDWVEERALTGT